MFMQFFNQIKKPVSLAQANVRVAEKNCKKYLSCLAAQFWAVWQLR